MRTYIIPLLVACAWLSCRSAHRDPQAFILDIQSRIQPLSKALALANWQATATGSEAWYKKQADLELKMRSIFSDKNDFARIKALREDVSITDPLLRRQIEILYLNYLENQLDPGLMKEMVKQSSAIEAKFNTHRASLDGKTVSDNVLAEVLQKETNVVRRKAAWEASKTVGESVAADLISLVKLRNQCARKLGFKNFYEMRMIINEQNPEEILALFDEMARFTEVPFAIIKDRIDAALCDRFNIRKAELRPYHYQDFFFQEVQDIGGVDMDADLKEKDTKALVENFYGGMGLPVAEFMKRSDLYERPGKYQHAYCTDIDREGDVRTMCSIRNNRYWLETLLHETGHGVYSMNIDRSLPWLLREESHTFVTEAIAQMFGSMPTNPEWLVGVAGIPKDRAEKWTQTLDMERKMGLLLFCRWSEVMVHFERALYENPDQDLDTLWWDLAYKYQGLHRIEGRHKPDWAAKIHLASYPVYYHNYMLGNLLASQLLHTMARTILHEDDIRKVSFLGMPELGTYLKERIFTPGKKYRWDDLIRRATGESLTPVYFARDVMISTVP